MNYTALLKATIIFLIVLLSFIGLGYLLTCYTIVSEIVIVIILLVFMFWVIYEAVKLDD